MGVLNEGKYWYRNQKKNSKEMWKLMGKMKTNRSIISHWRDLNIKLNLLFKYLTPMRQSVPVKGHVQPMQTWVAGQFPILSLPGSALGNSLVLP